MIPYYVIHTERYDLKIGERHFCIKDEESDTILKWLGRSLSILAYPRTA